MRPFRLIFVLFFLLAAGSPARAVSSSVNAPHLQAQLVTPEDQIYPGGDNSVGLYFKLEPGWHVYWKNAGDSGEAPRIQWTLPEGVTAGPMQFPAPKRLPLGPLMDFGYENEVLFPMKLEVAPTVRQGKAVLHAKVNWLVCREVCIPGKAELETVLGMLPTKPPAEARSAVDADLMSRFEKLLPTPAPADYKVVFQPTKDGFRLGIVTGRKEREAVFFPDEQNILDNPAKQTVLPTSKGLILELKKDASLTAAPAQLAGVLELAGGRAFAVTALPGKVEAGGFEFFWLPLMRTFALALLGGLLLNLMPCVFPVLFLKGLALVNSGNEDRHKLRAHGLVYAGGILVSFWVLVGVLLGLRAAGASLGWGFQFQSPVFLALMAGLLFFLGLSLAGQFEIGLTLTSAGGGLAAKQGYTGSFFTGVLAVVVATPCTAPFMGAAIGYALAQSAGVTFAVFTALALGLAAPYVALTLQPAWTRLLPKPGAWMEVLRQAVSVPIFGTVIWLAWVIANAYGATMLAALLAGFLLLAIAGWFLGRWPAKGWSAVLAGLIVLCVVGLSIYAKTDSERVNPGFHAGHVLSMSISSEELAKLQQNSIGRNWEGWSADSVSKFQSQGNPVFVDFTAKWCLSCQVNERVALTRPEVMSAFADHHVALMKADWTQHDDAIARELERLGRSGVPVYALYLPGEAKPRLLPEALTPGIVLDALNSLPRRANQAAVDSAKK